MALSQEEMNCLAATLDKCDAALADKPTLSRIFGNTWRARFREQVLAVHSLVDVAFPEAYYAPCLIDTPPDYQQRIEEGATIILTKLTGWARKDFFSRLQSREPASATEELLLARGFFKKFGDIEPSQGNRAASRPEFTVFIEGHTIAVEARGLFNSRTVQKLNEDSWRSGQHYWISTDPSIGNSIRARKALAEKLLESADDLPQITVLTLYSAFEVSTCLTITRQMALRPESLGIPQEKFPLAIGLVSDRLLQGIWFNHSVEERLCYSGDTKDDIRAAIKNSLYPRADGVFLHEEMSDEEHDSVIWKHS